MKVEYTKEIDAALKIILTIGAASFIGGFIGYFLPGGELLAFLVGLGIGFLGFRWTLQVEDF